MGTKTNQIATQYNAYYIGKKKHFNIIQPTKISKI